MSKARDLADSVSTGGILEDGAVSVSEISDLTVTAEELNNVAGVNSDVQTQLDLKAPLASPTFTGDATFDTDTLAVDSTNNRVGVGTTTPNSRLEVLDDVNDAKLKITATAADRAALLDLTGTIAGYNWISSDTNGTADWRIGGGTASGTLTFATGSSNTEAMRIDSNGRVGIGDTPKASFTGHSILQVGGQAILGANDTLSTTSQTYLSHNLYFDTSGNYQVFNTGSANEGAVYTQFDGIHRWSNSAATTGTPTVQERLRIGQSGELGIGGANYGTAGQVLTSGGSGAAPTWADAAAGSGTITATADGSISAGDAVVLQSDGTVKSVQEIVTEQTPLSVGFNSNVITISPNNIDYGFGGNMHYHEDTNTVFYFWETGGDVYMTSLIYNNTTDNWSVRQSNVFIGDNHSGNHLSSDYNPNTGHVLISWKDSSGYYRFVGMYVYKNVNNNLFDYYKTSQSTYGTVRSGGAEQIAIACSFTDNYFRLAWLDTNSALRVFTISVTGTSNVSVSHIGYADIDTNMGNTEYLSMAWDSNNNKFGLVVRHGNQSDYGYIYYFSTSTSTGSILTSQFAQFYNSGYVTYTFVEFNPEDECFVVMFDYASGAGIKQVDVNANGTLTVVGGSSSVVNIDGFHSQLWRDMRYDSASRKIVYGRRSLGASTNMIVGRITTSGSSPTAANTESDLYTSVNTGEALGVVSMPNVSKFAGIIEPNSGNIQIKAFQSASTTSNNTDWIGFASEAISNAASGDILVVGSTAENQSGLTTGSTYYVQTDGSLATTTTDAIKVGRALSATKLLITEANA